MLKFTHLAQQRLNSPEKADNQNKKTAENNQKGDL